jgi:Sec-independent protein translocase protein TatA
MIIILGLVILVAAVIVGVAGVLTNGGSAHGLAHGFAVFGYHVTGSTGTLFLYGIVVGAVGLFGLWLLVTGARRASRRGRAARRGLKESRRETAAVTRERDDLIDQRDTGRADAASALANPQPGASPGHSPDDDSQLSPDEGRRSRPRLFGRRPAPTQPAATAPEPMPGQSAPGIPADAPSPQGDSERQPQ